MRFAIALLSFFAAAMPAAAQLDAVPEEAKAAYRRGVTLERLDDREGANRQFQQACDAGDTRGCIALAHTLRIGDRVPQDFERAFALYAKACDMDNPAGCSGVAYMHNQGNGVDQDFDAALEAYKEACDLGEMSGCAGAGNILVAGQASTRNRTEGARLLRQACANEYDWACTRLRDLGQPRDLGQ